jgi:hypothetical protein
MERIISAKLNKEDFKDILIKKAFKITKISCINLDKNVTNTLVRMSKTKTKKRNKMIRKLRLSIGY